MVAGSKLHYPLLGISSPSGQGAVREYGVWFIVDKKNPYAQSSLVVLGTKIYCHDMDPWLVCFISHHAAVMTSQCFPHNWPIITLRPRRNEQHFADDIFKRIFFNENVWISIKIFDKKVVPRGPINNISALVQIMAWRRPGDKPLSEPMMVRSTTHICVTRPQWVIWGVDRSSAVFVSQRARYMVLWYPQAIKQTTDELSIILDAMMLIWRPQILLHCDISLVLSTTVKVIDASKFSFAYFRAGVGRGGSGGGWEGEGVSSGTLLQIKA